METIASILHQRRAVHALSAWDPRFARAPQQPDSPFLKIVLCTMAVLQATSPHEDGRTNGARIASTSCHHCSPGSSAVVAGYPGSFYSAFKGSLTLLSCLMNPSWYTSRICPFDAFPQDKMQKEQGRKPPTDALWIRTARFIYPPCNARGSIFCRNYAIDNFTS